MSTVGCLFSITMFMWSVKLNIVFSVAGLISGALGSENLKISTASDEIGRHLKNMTSESKPWRGKGRQLYKELVDKLFQDYNPIIPANAEDPTTSINLTVLMVIESLAYLDMKSQTLNIIAWFQIDWNDPSFAWDTDVYPVDMIVVNEKDVWRPVLAIANTLLPRDQIMKVELPVSIFPSGDFRWFPGDSFVMSCHVNLNFYPFDMQTCTVTLTQWSHQSHHFNCTQAEIRSTVSGNGEWEIIHLGYYHKRVQVPGYSFWILVFTITLKRKWMFYVLNLIFPIILVSALNNVVFMLPVECGDKMSVSVTTFLTLGVFLTLIQDSLAKNSDTVCYLTLYLAVQMTLGALAIVQSAVVVTCHHRAASENRDDSGRSFKEKAIDTFEELADDSLLDSQVMSEENHSSEADHWDPRASQMSRRSGKKGGDPVDADDIGHKKSSSRDWTRIAAKIDSICFPVFVGLNIMSLFVFCIIIVSA